MPNDPFISIVIPFHNSVSTLPRLVEALSAAEISEERIELIAVNDGSADGGADVLAAAGFHVLSNAPGKGPAAARNKGARAARGEVLLFLDADVIVRSGLAAHVRKRFCDDENLVALSGVYDKEPAVDGFFPRYKALRCHDWFTGVERFGSLETACAAVRREAFLASGGFDESFEGADVEDYEFGYRLDGARGIEVDHAMVVKHHFPTFGKNLENYAKRSYQWAKLKRPRSFDTAATTPREGLAAFCGVMSIPMFFLALALGNAWLNIVSFGMQGIHVFLRRRFYTLCHNEEGPRFTVLAVLATLAGDAVVIPSAAAGYLARFFHRES